MGGERGREGEKDEEERKSKILGVRRARTQLLTINLSNDNNLKENYTDLISSDG